MKLICKIFLGVLLLLAVEFGFSGCVADGGGYVSGSESIYYGSDPWFHDGPWLDGRHGYRNAPGAYIHPPAYHGRGPTPGHTADHHPGPDNHGPSRAPDNHPAPNHPPEQHQNQDRH